LGGKKSIRPVKNWWGDGVVICLERGADLNMAQPVASPGMGHWGTCPLEFDASFFSGLTQS